MVFKPHVHNYEPKNFFVQPQEKNFAASIDGANCVRRRSDFQNF